MRSHRTFADANAIIQGLMLWKSIAVGMAQKEAVGRAMKKKVSYPFVLTLVCRWEGGAGRPSRMHIRRQRIGS
jgi:hypothetical protein